MHSLLVVGYDGSPASIRAARWTADEAVVRAASVQVVSSLATPRWSTKESDRTRQDPIDGQLSRARCSDDVNQIVAELRVRCPGVAFESALVETALGDAIVAASGCADLVVVPYDGVGVVRGFLHHATTAVVLQHSRCPVIVVPPEFRRRTLRVAVGVDGSAGSDDALLWGCDEADRLGAELLVVHAWEYPYRVTVDHATTRSDFARVDAALVLDRAAEMARDRCSGRVRDRLIEHEPAEALLDAGMTADILVLGSHGHTAMRSMLLGSVARSVAARSVCPVAVIRSSDGADRLHHPTKKALR